MIRIISNSYTECIHLFVIFFQLIQMYSFPFAMLHVLFKPHVAVAAVVAAFTILTSSSGALIAWSSTISSETSAPNYFLHFCSILSTVQDTMYSTSPAYLYPYMFLSIHYFSTFHFHADLILHCWWTSFTTLVYSLNSYNFRVY